MQKGRDLQVHVCCPYIVTQNNPFPQDQDAEATSWSNLYPGPLSETTKKKIIFISQIKI